MGLNRRRMLWGVGGTLLGAAMAEARLRQVGFELSQVQIGLRDLDPAHDGMRVVQLSDIHVGGFTPDELVLAAVDTLNALRPELVVLTGDFVTTRRDPVDRVPELLRAIRAPTAAVLGNHDHWTYPARLRKGLEGCGIAVLQNAHTEIRLRGAPVRIIGIDDGRTRNDDVAASFRGVPAGGTRLVLTHTPSTARRLPPDKGLLCLSGHTHGGLFVVPGVTSALLRLVGEPYVRGQYNVGGNLLYVNRGLGTGRPIPRVGCRPEVTVFTLCRVGPSRSRPDRSR